MNDIGSRLVEYRARFRLSQAEMAEKCGVSTQTISLVERGAQKPNRVTLAKLEMVVGKENENGEVQHIAD